MSDSAIIATIAALYFALMLGMGFFFQKKQTGSVADYFAAKDTGIGPWVLAFSYMATAISAGTYMGEVAQTRTMGYTVFYMAVMSCVGSVLNHLVLGKRCFVLGKKLNVITTGDLLSYRFSSPKAIRIVQAVVLLVCITASMVAQFQASGIIFNVMVGVPVWVGALLGAVCAGIYVSVGGFLAVAWTDLIQGIIMIFGGLSVFIGCLVKYGSLASLNMQIAAQNPEFVTATGATDPQNIWLWFFIFAIGHFGYVPSFCRFFSAKKLDTMRKSIVMVAIANIGFHFFGKLSGLYSILAIPNLTNDDAALSSMAILVLPPVLAGLLLAAILGAAMSSIDSLVLLLSGVCVHDVVEKTFNIKLEQKKMLHLCNLVSALVTVVGLIIALNPPAAIMWVGAFAWGGITSTFAAPMILGLYWKRGNGKGAVAGMVSGFGIAMLWYLLNHPGIHGLVLGYIVNFVVNIVVSLCTAPPPKEVIDNCFPTKEEMATYM